MTEAVGSKCVGQIWMDQKLVQLVRLGSSYKVNSIDGKRKEDQTYVIKMSILKECQNM